MTENQIACLLCEYYDKAVDENYEESHGFCHRYAPRPIYGIDISNDKTYWPKVNALDYCGEFSRR